MQFPVHEVLHAPLRLSVSFANHIKNLFPEFVNTVAQHTEIKSLATAWKKDKKPNLCGKKAAYFFRKLALLIKPLLTQEESIANLKLLSFFFILAKVRNIVGIMKTTKKHTQQSIQLLSWVNTRSPCSWSCLTTKKFSRICLPCALSFACSSSNCWATALRKEST